jgi:dihydroneopterin aldolase
MPSVVRIVMADLETARRVGVHPWERHPEHPNRLIVNVVMEIALGDYYGAAGRFIDYDPIRKHLQSWPTAPHVDHLESLLEDVVSFIFASTPAARATVRIVKPDIFHEAGGVGVEYDVARADWAALKR